MMDKDVIVAFWNRVDEALNELGITVKFMSDITGLDYMGVKAWRARKRIPNPEALSKISEFLKLPLDYLIKGELTNPNDAYLPYIEHMEKTDPEKMRVIREMLGMKETGGGAETSSDSTHSMVG